MSEHKEERPMVKEEEIDLDKPLYIPREEIVLHTFGENVQIVRAENPDSITFGSATKGGALKVYGDFNKREEFEKKIDNAKKVREYADANVSVNI